MNSLSFIFLSCLCMNVSSLNEELFFSFGDDVGDTVLVHVKNNLNVDKSDDGIFHVDTEHIPLFDLVNNTRFQLSTNGYCAFGAREYDEPSPVKFPRLHHETNITAPQIACYHTDLIFSSHEQSKLSYKVHDKMNGISTINQANREIQHYLGLSFQSKRVFVATWKKVASYQDFTDEHNTFQMGLATDDIETYLFLHYGENNFKEFMPTMVGWQGESVSNYFTHPLSQLEEDQNDQTLNRPIRLQSESNVGEPGKWIYRVSKSLVKLSTIAPSPTRSLSPCPSFDPLVCERHEIDGSFYHEGPFYIVCDTGHEPRCLRCPNEDQHYEEKCDQCLANGVTECATTDIPVTATLANIPFGGCTNTAANQFCKDKSSGRYANVLDSKDSTFFWCYETGSSCMNCAAGSKFCLIETNDGSSDGRCF